MTEETLQVQIDTDAAMSGNKPQEKMVPQSEVNDLIGRLKHEAYQKGLRESVGANNSHGNQFDEQSLRQMMQEEAVKAQERTVKMAMAQHVFNEFATKMAPGKEKYADFEEKVATLDLPRIPVIAELAAGVPNTDEVMYELANNPYKVGNLLMLKERAPHLAALEMQKLSKSITDNQKAAAVAIPKEPLGHVKPSATTGEDAPMTLEDFKKAKWLR